LDPAQLDDIPGQIERSVQQSLERLDRGSVDLLLLHNPITAQGGDGAVTPEQVLRLGGAADGLQRMQAQGLTRYIGMTALGEAASCIRVIESGRFDAAQVYYNLLNPSAARAMPPAWRGHHFDGVIAACKAQGTAVMAIRIFAAGVLASDVRHGREVVITTDAELQAEAQRARAVFAELGETHGSRAQTAVRYALSNPDVACAVIGLAEPAHLDEALAAQALGPLPASAMQALDRLYARNFGMTG
ncbi:MAG: aldo/keto reductase, partial [Burkholderiales bacterium]|nr:aldo/keto reductase [Burkholderiales bacterium]